MKDLEFLDKLNRSRIIWIHTNLSKVKKTVSLMYKEDDISEIYIDLHKIYNYANNTLCTKKEMNNIIKKFIEIDYIIKNRKYKYILGDAILKLGKSELNHMISSELSNPISWYNFTEKMIIN